MTPHYYHTVGKVTLEKLESLRSKMKDNTATSEDVMLVRLLQEIEALAKNRMSVSGNEQKFDQGKSVWVERTSQSHFPHIRLHGGALEDDPIA